MASLSIPTTSALPSTQLLPASHPTVTKTFHRLSRPSLLSLVLDWLDERNSETTFPYLSDPANDDEDGDGDEQELYPPAKSLRALREIYTDLQAKKGSKRDVVDRIVEGDWRNGITLYQLAMADMQYLYDHPSSQKWTALKIVRLEEDSISKKPPSIPRFHPSTFLRNLQKEILPDVKAHYNLDRHAKLPLTILRIFIIESPYNTSAALNTQKQQRSLDSSKTFYVAFPDASPYVYVSLTTSYSPASSSDNKSLRKLTLDGIPKAFSRPRERYKLESTSLSARNLEALVERRGGSRTNSAGGGWGVYAEGKKKNDNPLRVQQPTPEASVGVEDEVRKEMVGMKRKRGDDERLVQSRKAVAQGRFGNSGKLEDGKGIERLDVLIEDPFPTSTSTQDEEEAEELSSQREQKKKGRRSMLAFELDRDADTDDVASEGWRPDVKFTFNGSHVFAGIRELVEAGIVDGEKMPGWMTGEEGVSVGRIRYGRIVGHKGSGL